MKFVKPKKLSEIKTRKIKPLMTKSNKEKLEKGLSYVPPHYRIRNGKKVYIKGTWKGLKKEFRNR